MTVCIPSTVGAVELLLIQMMPSVVPPLRRVECLGTGSTGWLGMARLPNVGATVAGLVTLPAVGHSQEGLALEDAPCPLEHALLAPRQALFSRSRLQPVRYQRNVDDLAAPKQPDVLLVSPRPVGRLRRGLPDEGVEEVVVSTIRPCPADHVPVSSRPFTEAPTAARWARASASAAALCR
jgi:hypothetical protein